MVTLSYACPHCHRLLLESYIGWVSTGHGDSSKTCGDQYNWKDPNRVLLIQDSADSSEATVFPAHVTPQGARENLICAVKMLANWQTDGDHLVDTIFEDLQKQTRLKITNEPRRFIEVQNHEAGDLDWN